MKNLFMFLYFVFIMTGISEAGFCDYKGISGNFCDGNVVKTCSCHYEIKNEKTKWECEKRNEYVCKPDCFNGTCVFGCFNGRCNQLNNGIKNSNSLCLTLITSLLIFLQKK